MRQEEEFRQLQMEHQILREQWEEQVKETQVVREQLAVALARREELEKKKTEPPSFVKANVDKSKEKKPREKRAPEKNGARKRETPTRIEEHFLRTCPVCHMGLGGISLAHCRQVVELPPPPPVEVIEHRI